MQDVNSYTASVGSTGRRTKVGPFLFEERCFTDSDGHQAIAWGCMTRSGGCTNRRAGTKRRALRYWLSYRLECERWKRRKF